MLVRHRVWVVHEEMFDHPQVMEQGLVAEFEHPRVGRYRGFANPIQFRATAASKPFAVRDLEQDAEKTLREWGFSIDEVEEFLGNLALTISRK